MSDMKAKYINDPDKKFAIKINFNTVSRELIFTEMAFLKLVNSTEHGSPQSNDVQEEGVT